MKYFLKKALQWTVYLAVTVLFFSLPVIIEDCGNAGKSDRGQMVVDSVAAIVAGGIFFEFDSASVNREVAGDSTSVRLITNTDSSRKLVLLYVNGVKQDMAVVSDSLPAVFTRVYLSPGENEITAVLSGADGRALSIRKARIFSSKRM